MKTIFINGRNFYVPDLLAQSQESQKHPKTFKIRSEISNKEEFDKVEYDSPDCLVNKIIEENKIEDSKKKEQEKKLIFKKPETQTNGKVPLISQNEIQKPKLIEHPIKKRFTHFISFPVNQNEALDKKIKQFRNRVLEISTDYKYFFNNNPLHITIVMLSLTDKEVNFLKEVLTQMTPHLKLIFPAKSSWMFKLDGIGSFGSMSDAEAVFGEVKGNWFLKNIRTASHVIIENLVNTGLVEGVKDLPHVSFNEKYGKYEVDKFHVTLMKKGDSGSNLDVSLIMSNLGGFKFGDLEISRIALHKMDSEHTQIFTVNL